MPIIIWQFLLQLMAGLPLLESTIQGIRQLLAKDPNVPADLQAILASGDADDQAVLTRAAAWAAAHPEPPADK